MDATPPIPNRDAWTSLLSSAAQQFGTPCYVTRWRPVAHAVEQLEGAIHAPLPLRCWLSFKTHPLPPLLHAWVRSGRGVEVVSESEFLTATYAGVPVDRILVNGIARHTWLTKYPVRGLQVHLDSPRELAALRGQIVEQQWRIGIRCHAPDECDARDSTYGGQFGMTRDEAVRAIRTLRDAGADVRGLHFHVGQRPMHANAYTRGLWHLARVSEEAGFAPRYVDLGGGLPGAAAAADALEDLRAAVAAAPRALPGLQEVWLEHGRFVSEASTALVVRVIDVKRRADCRYLICDGGRTNHALAADHGLHPIFVIPARRGTPTLTAVCGPTCMTDDILGRLPLPDDIAVGDVIAWMNAGAYHLPWETRFSHGLCAVAWSDADDRLVLARPRESAEMWSQSWTVTVA
jgi:diaminopimelate decarboxylase